MSTAQPTNFQGHLLIAQPRCVSNFFSRSTVLIARHSQDGAWGVIVNRVFSRLESGLTRVCAGMGVELDPDLDQPIWVGGPVETNRIHVVHTMDWHSQSTLAITADLGITSDLSVITAIAGREGPQQFRVCIGMCGWSAGQLEGEMSGMPPWLPEHRWLWAPATEHNVFDFSEVSQWQHGIMTAASITTSQWL